MKTPVTCEMPFARFNEGKDVSDDERDAAWKRIKSAAKKHGVEINEKSWREVGK